MLCNCSSKHHSVSHNSSDIEYNDDDDDDDNDDAQLRMCHGGARYINIKIAF